MSEQAILLQLEQRAEVDPPAVPRRELKLGRPERNQLTYAAIDVEALIGPQHPARAIWELAGQLDLRAFAEPLRNGAAARNSASSTSASIRLSSSAKC